MARGRLRGKMPFSPTSTATHWQTRLDNAAPWRSFGGFERFTQSERNLYVRCADSVNVAFNEISSPQTIEVYVV